MSYQQRRAEIYHPMREENFFLWDVNKTDGDEYALATIHIISPSFRQEIAYATEQLGKIFARTVQVVQNGYNGLLRELGLPRETWKAIRVEIDSQIPTLIGRFDFANTPKGLKMLEFNSDTPTSIVESFYVNDRVCSYFEVENPNKGMDQQLTRAFQRIIGRYSELGFRTEHIYFSALEWHLEDAGTTRYLMHLSGLPAKFVPLSSLTVYEDRLYVEDLEQKKLLPVDILYRLYPLEMLAEATDIDGYPTGAHILQLIANKKVGIINPPSAFIAQTKALQALIWSIHEQGVFYSEEEHEIIETYMIPTYFENCFHGQKAYVSKPIFGREGGAVRIFDQHGVLLAKDQAKHYWEQPMIYQEWVELEHIEVETLTGDFSGRLLWGSFLIDGEASAIIARVDKEITGDNSYYLPVGLK
ncbi:glutathionylspermidine synthase family protein [Thermoflavimicrobium dichotomicum]|uniref:Glutathionylspermidine synthase n=1 Tax=Thermoflavimicrobium dichotomicum TaxID=46223 RepID=A0A1I3JVH8_9BACL|nr:glutathionylspermidine synthase family protein [Thermoflavimicrobium dichotomicum]SFI64261.1 Glutathionylspermidine synthase [Thermoflavimicrobium dichotomicum]